MDATLRQIGIGDYVVGKHVGRMMGALGGRLRPFAPRARATGDFEAAVRRNIFHDAPPSDEAPALGRRRGWSGSPAALDAQRAGRSARGRDPGL